MMRLTCLLVLVLFGCKSDDSSQGDAGASQRSDASTHDAGDDSDDDAGATVGACDGGPRTCLCKSDIDCDDGSGCSGVERCEPQTAASDIFGCVPGTAQQCDDDIACTNDSCVDDACVFVARDADEDGEGDIACEDAQGKPLGRDCDDTNDDLSPRVTEICDEVDNDCDGKVDEGVSVLMYPDNDGDLRGAIGKKLGVQRCPGAEGYSAISTDCDDENPQVYGGHIEVCDELDNDCDGKVDEVGGCL